jgi:hypothetical protein
MLSNVKFRLFSRHPDGKSHALCATEFSVYSGEDARATIARKESETMIPLSTYPLVLGAVGLAIASYALLRRKPHSPDELERQRRVWLTEVGRITDGTVIDVQELTSESHRPASMLIYQYDVAGVSYEASQDVTYLRQWINLHSCRLGVPTSVKYDPHNPGNSMVVSEGWIGLRQ